jgi:lipopolysaccharide export LptBFGC system permease protein LptF
MVFTLQRYIFRELFKIFLLAAIGLTLILSLGGVLRPVQEYGVGPRQVVHILLYFMPVTLTFVLPMAALFASALAYGRFASDNELDACRASGISITTLVYPGLALAILVAIANLLLSFHVMPYFVHLAERSLKADAKQILFRNIQRRGYYCLPPNERFVIYADFADPKTSTLYGIVAVESKLGSLTKMVTCESAQVQFDSSGQRNEVRLTWRDARLIGGPDDNWIDNEAGAVRYEFGSLLGDDITFKKIQEMKQIRVNLMLFDPVAKMARDTYGQLAAELLAQDMRAAMGGSAAGAYLLNGQSRTVKLSAAGCIAEPGLAVSLLPPVIVEEYNRQTGTLLQKLSSEKEKATIYLDEDAPDQRVHLQLSNARVVGTGLPMIHHAIRDLAMPEFVKRSLAGGPDRLVANIAERPDTPETSAWGSLEQPSPDLMKFREALAREIRITLVDIQAEINSRLVFGIGCVPMILIGIGLGIIKRGGHLLGAFGVSCAPAVVLIVGIISGKHITQNLGSQAVSGILIMWAGLAFLILLTACIYAWLLRH